MSVELTAASPRRAKMSDASFRDIDNLCMQRAGILVGGRRR